MDKISTVVDELVKVLNAAKSTNKTILELSNKLLDTTHKVLEGVKPELKELHSLEGDSADQIAADLTFKINQNQAKLVSLRIWYFKLTSFTVMG